MNQRSLLLSSNMVWGVAKLKPLEFSFSHFSTKNSNEAFVPEKNAMKCFFSMAMQRNLFSWIIKNTNRFWDYKKKMVVIFIYF